jgi:hypothetical protein
MYKELGVIDSAANSSKKLPKVELDGNVERINPDRYERITVNTERPILFQKASEILNKLLNHNVDNPSIADSNFSINILDSIVSNAYIEIESKKIFITTNLLQAIHSFVAKPENSAYRFNDLLAFILAHEISHVIYDKSGGQTDRELTATAMEDYCDKQALELMYKAGFDINSATFKIFQKTSGWSHTHSASSDRENKIEDYKTNEFYSIRNMIANQSNQNLDLLAAEELEIPGRFDFLKPLDVEGTKDSNSKTTKIQLDSIKPQDCVTIQMAYCKCYRLLIDYKSELGIFRHELYH